MNPLNLLKQLKIPKAPKVPEAPKVETPKPPPSPWQKVKKGATIAGTVGGVGYTGYKAVEGWNQPLDEQQKQAEVQNMSLMERLEKTAGQVGLMDRLEKTAAEKPKEEEKESPTPQPQQPQQPQQPEVSEEELAEMEAAEAAQAGLSPTARGYETGSVLGALGGGLLGGVSGIGAGLSGPGFLGNRGVNAIVGGIGGATIGSVTGALGGASIGTPIGAVGEAITGDVIHDPSPTLEYAGKGLAVGGLAGGALGALGGRGQGRALEGAISTATSLGMPIGMLFGANHGYEQEVRNGAGSVSHNPAGVDKSAEELMDRLEKSAQTLHSGVDPFGQEIGTRSDEMKQSALMNGGIGTLIGGATAATNPILKGFSPLQRAGLIGVGTATGGLIGAGMGAASGAARHALFAAPEQMEEQVASEETEDQEKVAGINAKVKGLALDGALIGQKAVDKIKEHPVASAAGAAGLAGYAGAKAGSSKPENQLPKQAEEETKEEKVASEQETFMNELYKEAAAAIIQESIPSVKKYVDPMSRIRF